MDTDTEALCGHTYTTLGNRVFRCTLKPHPTRPDNHYFERDHAAQDRLNARDRNRSRLVVIPGERRG
jgi:hypothetical protein